LTFAFTPKAGFAVSVILLFLVIILGLAVAHNRGQGLDNAISSALALRDGRSSPLTIAFWQGISWTGTGVQRYILVAALGLWLVYKRHWRYGAGFALASLLSLAASEYLKASFARPRPTIVPHLDFTNNFAYPSGHATSAAVVYLLFALLVPTQKRGRWLVAAFILAFLTGVSRVILGVHWPSDVIGGWMLGSFFAIAMATILQHTERKP
jgi:undecaprenyl-diphosphatase